MTWLIPPPILDLVTDIAPNPYMEYFVMRNPLSGSIARLLGTSPGLLERNVIFTPGPAVAELSGSIGGTTFSRNKGGGYMRKRAVPTNPDTILQQAVRTDFATLITNWTNVLTQGQRDAWNDYAEANPVLNKLGQSRLLSGQQWYVKLNAVLLQASIAPTNNAPTQEASPQPDPTLAITQADNTVNDMTVAFDDTQSWTSTDDAFMILYMGKPQSAGSNNVKVPFRLLAVFLGDSLLPITSPIIIDPTSWNMENNEKVFIEARIVAPNSLQSDRFRSDFFLTVD